MKLYMYSKFILLIFALSFISCNSQSNQQQKSAEVENKPELEVKTQSEKLLAEVACGECQFDLEGVGCDLAIKIDGIAYFVDSIGIDDLGDAHAEEGLCNAIRNANVEGYLKDDRFIAKSIELIPVQKE